MFCFSVAFHFPYIEIFAIPEVCSVQYVCCNIRNVKFIKSYAVEANVCNSCLRFILIET